MGKQEQLSGSFPPSFFKVRASILFDFIREGRTKDKEVASTRPISQSMATQIAPSEER